MIQVKGCRGQIRPKTATSFSGIAKLLSGQKGEEVAKFTRVFSNSNCNSRMDIELTSKQGAQRGAFAA
jgi:hypothetical protein